MADLHGQIHVVLDGRIDSVNRGIRNTFEVVPDAPVTKFVLEMQGGKKGLLVNNTQPLQGDASRATVQFDGQNGKSANSEPRGRPTAARRRKHEEARQACEEEAPMTRHR